MAYELHDQALAALRNTGPELRNGAPNHAPMVIEALTVLGHDDAILPWIENFRPQLADDPRTSVVLDGEWEAALGDYTRLGAWQNLFRRELQSASWTDVLETWLPRLIPGSMASGTHGIIRCGHASRALANAVTPARLDELAKALAYCAARYRLVGGEPRLDGVLALEQRPAAPCRQALERAARFHRCGGSPRATIQRFGRPERIGRDRCAPLSARRRPSSPCPPSHGDRSCRHSADRRQRVVKARRHRIRL